MTSSQAILVRAGEWQAVGTQRLHTHEWHPVPGSHATLRLSKERTAHRITLRHALGGAAASANPRT